MQAVLQHQVLKCHKIPLRYNWTREEVDAKLDRIMVDIHKNAAETAEIWNA